MMQTPSTYYLPGPDPALEAPPFGEALEAQKALTHAFAVNSDNGAMVAGIAPEQAETLLKWIVYKARMGLKETPSPSKSTEYFSPEHLSGMCGDGFSYVGRQTEAMGIKTHYHQLRDLTEGKYFGHVFCVASLPVMEHGTVTAKPYLIDTTFRQYFNSTPTKKHTHLWGKELVTTEEGKAIADALLRDGFMPLTAQSAERYVHASDIHFFFHTPILEAVYPDLMAQLLGNGEASVRFGEIHKRLDLRSPIEVQHHLSAAQSWDVFMDNRHVGDAPWWDVPASAVGKEPFTVVTAVQRDSSKRPPAVGNIAR